MRRGQIGDYWLTTNQHGTWQRTWYDPATRHVRHASLGTKHYEQAIVLLAEWVTLNVHLNREQPTDVPLLAIMRRYHEEHARRKTARKGEMSSLAMKKVENFMPDDTVGGFNKKRQAEFEAHLEGQGLSAGYIGRIQTVIKAAVNWAHENDEIASAPFVRVTSLGGTRERILAPAETKALFMAPKPPYMALYGMLLFCTLSRPGALLEATPTQVDFNHGLIDLNPPGRKQTKKFRPTVPIAPRLLPWLETRQGERFLVQASEDQEQPLRSVKTAWRAIIKRAGLPKDITPYTIRHTMATRMRSRGVPKWEVAGWLGHRGGVTDVYGKFEPGYLRAGVQVIEGYFEELGL